MKIKDTNTALALFEESAIKYAEAIEQGDESANKWHASAVKAFDFINAKGEILRLVQFLNHPSVGVRIWAATYLLPVKEEEATKVLEEISGREDIHSISAEITLKEWRKRN